VQICRILAKKAIMGLIFPKNRKRQFYVVFRYWLKYAEKKKSLKWAISPQNTDSHISGVFDRG